MDALKKKFRVAKWTERDYMRSTLLLSVSSILYSDFSLIWGGIFNVQYAAIIKCIQKLFRNKVIKIY